MKIIGMLSMPWAIIPERIEQMCTVVDAHLRGPKLNLKDLEYKALSLDDFQPHAYRVENGVAIVPIVGPISKSPDIFDRVMLGMVSSSQIKQDFQAAVDDDQVKAIVLYIDSPGGTVDGTQELADVIYAARGKKPITAFSDGLIASAAYWIGSAADKIIISSDTVMAGSIGVYTSHIDYSEADRQMGIKVTEISAGKYKTIASPNKPLSDEGREYIQDRVDYLYSVFVDAVARNRGVYDDEALEMADGKIFTGKQAIEAGLVDGVSTMDQLLHTAVSEPVGVPAQAVVHLITKLEIPGAASSNETRYASKEFKEADMPITHEQLAKDAPELYSEIIEKGKSEAEKAFAEKLDAEKAAAKAEGKAEEIERIKAVKALSMPGHEALVEEMMFDGKTTAAEAAIRIVNAEKSKKVAQVANLENGSPKPVPQVVPPADPAVQDMNKPVEERAKAEWDGSRELRAEFSDDFNAYLAYKKADENGRARVFKGGRK